MSVQPATAPTGPRSVWSLGDMHAFARATTWSVGPVLVQACDIHAGQRVLDVAAGSGNVALRADRVRLRNTGPRQAGEADGASIATSSAGAGNAGFVTLDVRHLTLDNASVKASAASPKATAPNRS